VCLAFNEVLNSPYIDGIAITTPAETHCPLAREALLEGKHVFVEKPLVLNEDEGVELILSQCRRPVDRIGFL
jgi:UDP-2-acetamido-3-amino-2,3-dideoxy-glucuronate N-acetyltransferase